IVVVALVGYRVLARAPAPPPPIPAAAAPEPVTTPPAPAALETPSPTVEAPSVSASASAVEPAAGLSPSPSASTPVTEPAASAAPAASGESHTVNFKSTPPKARFYHFGKEVGTAPFSLEFKPGERHSYEVGLPGYITRKVTVDGSTPEITVGLRKNSR
ncbi:MAG: PEGA domain-containing protein, partial [Polyangiaceae bacterium]